MLVAKAHPILARPNPSKQPVNSHRVDINLDNQPDIGIMMTSAINAEVKTQLTSSGPAAKPALIWSKELPTI